MFTSKDVRLLSSPYFHVIRKADTFYEIQSLNTKHCWIVQKHPSQKIVIYHKHTLAMPYYHHHTYSFSVQKAIEYIKDHDAHVLS